MLVDDRPDAPRPSSPRSRIEKEFLPDGFAGGMPARRSSDFGNDVRVRRRGPVRKGLLPAWTKTRWGRVLFTGLVLAALAAIVFASLAVRSFFEHDPRFRIDSAASVQTVGNSVLTRDQLLSIFGADIGRNIFYIPMARRRTELERIPWVEHATVMRLLPDQLRVAVRERVPIAFVRVGDQIKLVDAAGVILDMSPAMMASRKFSFPVVSGINPTDPLSMRAARMQLYQKFIRALDSSGEHLSANLSEVDLSDPEDVRATVPSNSSDLLLHFGDTNFLARYRIYQSHLSGWRQQYPNLAGVDLRYENEVVLKMADPGAGAGDQSTGPSAQGSGSAKPATASKAAPAKKTTAKKHTHSVHHARKRK
ncbi:MAG TPA: FtsQ-type POTRA domain-containing protein [Acidobacteriaceae bacterium]|jgi:cell division protein FtsQ|nr:FtsQ-type POTRA domain-containing protein [Acidobacteriaceae bacterium]